MRTDQFEEDKIITEDLPMIKSKQKPLAVSRFGNKNFRKMSAITVMTH